MIFGPRGPRGLLSNYPEDVILIVNGIPVTKANILQAKRARQERELRAKRRSLEPTFKPCFIWVFFNEHWIYHGWWLYIHFLHSSRKIGIPRERELALKMMRIFPCGHLPLVENFEQWKAGFAAEYHRPTNKRPERQGMAVAWAKFSPNGMIIDIQNMNGARQCHCGCDE